MCRIDTNSHQHLLPSLIGVQQAPIHSWHCPTIQLPALRPSHRVSVLQTRPRTASCLEGLRLPPSCSGSSTARELAGSRGLSHLAMQALKESLVMAYASLQLLLLQQQSSLLLLLGCHLHDASRKYGSSALCTPGLLPVLLGRHLQNWEVCGSVGQASAVAAAAAAAVPTPSPDGTTTCRDSSRHVKLLSFAAVSGAAASASGLLMPGTRSIMAVATNPSLLLLEHQSMPPSLLGRFLQRYQQQR